MCAASVGLVFVWHAQLMHSSRWRRLSWGLYSHSWAGPPFTCKHVSECVAQGKLTLKGGFCSKSFISDLPNPGIKLTSASPALTGRFFTSEPPGKPSTYYIMLSEKKRKKEKPTCQNYIFTMGDYNTQKINKNLCLIRRQIFFFSSFCIFAFYVVMILIL